MGMISFQNKKINHAFLCYHFNTHFQKNKIFLFFFKQKNTYNYINSCLTFLTTYYFQNTTTHRLQDSQFVHKTDTEKGGGVWQMLTKLTKGGGGGKLLTVTVTVTVGDGGLGKY